MGWYESGVADPQHIEKLDGFDRLTVRLYRAGLSVGSVSLITGGVVFASGLASDPARAVVWGGVALGAALCATSMHLYAKRIRWVISLSTALGLVVMGVAGGAAGHALTFHAGLGLVFVAYSAWALKEQFCFKIKFLRAVPLFLAGSLIPLLGAQGQVAGLMLVSAGVMYGILAVAKLRMPVHFDIGDKSAYQI